MAPGVMPVPSRRKIRPSSAAAKLQSHRKFTTGLFDDGHAMRPATAGPLAGTGPRFGSRTDAGAAETEAAVAKATAQRRLTVSEVDGIANSATAYRVGIPQHSIGHNLKGHVSHHAIAASATTSLSLAPRARARARPIPGLALGLRLRLRHELANTTLQTRLHQCVGLFY